MSSLFYVTACVALSARVNVNASFGVAVIAPPALSNTRAGSKSAFTDHSLRCPGPANLVYRGVSTSAHHFLADAWRRDRNALGEGAKEKSAHSVRVKVGRQVENADSYEIRTTASF